MRLDQLIADADAFIEKRAAKKPEEVLPPSDETVKLANFLESFGEKEEVKDQASPFQMTFVEKLASAVAMVEALNNKEEFQKIAEFVSKAEASGYTPEQIDQFLEKRALKVPSSVAVPAIAATAAGLGGYLHGKKKGHSKAMTEVQQAFEQAAQANG